MKDIFEHIKQAVLEISREMKFPDTSYESSTNATGDTQLGFDIKSDAIIERILGGCASVRALISEEKSEICPANPGGKYVVAYDPLDGSSLFDVNFAVGSIFGMYEGKASSQTIKAAAYSIYSARLELVFCELGKPPKLYRLREDGDFALVRELKMAQKGKINACGGTQKEWSQTHANFIKSLFDEGYRLRYSGAMVSDIHQLLCKGGGLFSYPATSKAPQGKLRAFFEVLPMAFVVENAGGKTTDGKNSSLFELEFNALHATTPCFFGSSYEIDKLKSAYKGGK